MYKKIVALSVTVNIIATPALASAAALPGVYAKVSLPAVSGTEVPVLKTGGTLSGATVAPVSNNTLAITQTQSHAVIDWKTFNVGSAATVRFNQGYWQVDAQGKQVLDSKNQPVWVPQKSYSALNRIWDANPSQIYGSLVADGSVYLINQNGILFGSGSQVNVHSLVASTLNLRDQDFLNGVNRFTAEDYQNPGYLQLDSAAIAADYQKAVLANLALGMPASYTPTSTTPGAAVANHGSISTDNGGSVFLMAPTAENYGSINAPAGSVGIVGINPGNRKGMNYDLELNDTSSLSGYTTQANLTLMDRSAGGAAVNGESGQITADSGVAGMYGKTVAQNGLIRSVTAVKKGGTIELLASDSITTGAGSRTLTPISDASDTLITSTPSKGSVILAGLTGLNQEETNPNGSYKNNDYAPAAAITHQGTIQSPSGNVFLEASGTISLGARSVLDVSGVWVDEQASALLIHPQLNTQNLRDYYGQKTGPLLGQYVWVNSLTGTTVGDVSGYYGAALLTAREQSTKGGAIHLGSHTLFKNGVADDSSTAQVLVDKGATVDFSGGGYRYAPGVIASSALLAGNTVYDISSAPEWLSYSKILTTSSYFGGATQGSDAGSLSILSRQVTLDGTLLGSATRGAYQTLQGELTDKMGYQNTQGRAEPAGGSLNIGADNVLGVVNGTKPGWLDYVTYGIELVPDSASAARKGDANDSVISAGILNAAGLSSLSLYANETFTLDAGATLSLAPYGHKSASSSTTEALTVTARSLDIAGTINLPGGSVALNALDNVTSFAKMYDGRNATPPDNPEYLPMADQRVLLEATGRINVAGERGDNSSASLAKGSPAVSPLTAGGSISITDNTVTAYGISTGGIQLVRGAILDVSGGYLLSKSGSVTGGDAGSLSLTAPNLSLDGELRGYSLTGNKGGTLTLLTENIRVSEAGGASVPQGIALTGERFAGTGFTQLALKSYGDLTVEAGVTLAPSREKLAQPEPGQSTLAPTASGGGYDLISVSDDLVGSSSLTLASDASRDYRPAFDNNLVFQQFNYASQLSVAQGAVLEAAPGGSIALSGAQLEVDGTLRAPAGSIALSAKTDPLDTISYRAKTDPGKPGSGDLTVGAGAVLDAGGYNKPVYGAVAGVAAGYTPLAGGSISLSAVYAADPSQEVGVVDVKAGAQLEVSGSPSSVSSSLLPSGRVASTVVASNPGSITISYQSALDLNPGSLVAVTAPGSSQQGGSFSLARLSTAGELPLSDGQVSALLARGFDALSFKSLKGLALSAAAPGVVEVPRSLTLDAPIITGTGSDQVNLNSPWITLLNSYYPGATDITRTQSAGGATLKLTGGFLDVTGAVQLSGFQNVTLEASQDLRLSDRYYPLVSGLGPSVSLGALEAAGNLTLSAGRIYPTSQSVFTVKADSEQLVDAGGKALLDGSGNAQVVKHSITVLPEPNATPSDAIYSAFGQLTLQAGGGIDQEGYLAAPLGSITLDGLGSRVTLWDRSTTTTATSATVNVGSLDDSLNWTRTDNSVAAQLNPIPVGAEPGKSITVRSANGEIVTQGGAVVDVSGGGAVSAYSFVGDLAGTVSPISQKGSLNGVTVRPNRYVILPDHSVTLPGAALYLAGDNALGLQAGVYSLLPESYAFVPGALIVSALNTPLAGTAALKSKEGYDIVAGYATVVGTGIQAPASTGYTVRRASDVLREGHFETKSIAAFDAGAISFAAPSMLIDGSIKATGLAGYRGGSLTLAASNISIQNGDASTSLVAGSLEINASSLTGQGLEALTLGSLTGTDSVTVHGGDHADLSIPQITLLAQQSITLESQSRLAGAEVTLATGGGGMLTVQQGAAVHAGTTLNLTATGMDYQGTLQLDKGGALNVTGNGNVVFVGSAPTDGSASGNLYLTRSFTDNFASIDQVSIASASDIGFQENANASLAALSTLTLDAARIQANGGVAVTLTAPQLNLVNRGKSGAAQGASTGSASLTLDAQSLTVNVGNGDDGSKTWNLALNGFGTVNFGNAGPGAAYQLGDLSFAGVGTLGVPAQVNISAARITTGVYSDAATANKTARVTLDAGGQALSIAAGAGVQGAATTTGGFLAFKAGSISDAGSIEIPSGQVSLDALRGITLAGGASINAAGRVAPTANPDQYAYSPGGAVSLDAGSGPLTLAAGSTIDVSAADSGNAGSVTLAVPTGVLTLAGELKGAKGKGAQDQGGSFSLQAARLDGRDGGIDLSALNGRLAAGGFDREIDLLAHQGDLSVGAADTVKAGKIVLAADGKDSQPGWDAAAQAVTGNSAGSIIVNGTLDASGANGGEIDLLARNNLVLGDLSRTLACATSAGGAGGSVYLKAGDVVSDGTGYHSYGRLSVGGLPNATGGATIDVSGSGGGSVYLRTMRDDANAGVLLDFAPGAIIKGAGSALLEAVKVYAAPADGNLGELNTSSTGALYQDTKNFAGTTEFDGADLTPTTVSAGNFADLGEYARLAGLTALGGFRLLPGLEIRGAGPLGFTGHTWDLSTWRPGYGTPGVSPGSLTIRSGGDLTLGANLYDYAPSAPYANANDFTLRKENAAPSWGINLVAGADLAAGDPMGVAAASNGTLTISSPGKQVMVYTENAPIRFASAGDTFINVDNAGQSFVYNFTPLTLGTFSGTIAGKVGGDLYLNSGIIQSATGSIDLTVKGELDLSQIGGASYGSIRSTGQPAALDPALDPSIQFSEYWNYRDGGSIRVSAGGSIWGWNALNPKTRTRDGAYSSAGAWDSFTYQGDTNGYAWSANYGANDSVSTTQGIAAMGGGSVELVSGKDVATQAGSFGTGDLRVFAAGDVYGRYLTADGAGTLLALGNIGAAPVFGASNYLPGFRQPVLELMHDSSFAATAFGGISLGAVLDPSLTGTGWNPSYGTAASLSLNALGGGVSLLGESFDRSLAGNLSNKEILPQSVQIASAGDINFYINSYLAPSPTGNLELFSDGSIAGGYPTTKEMPTAPWITLQVLDNMYGEGGFYSSGLLGLGNSQSRYTYGSLPGDSSKPLHWGDPNPVRIVAKGDIGGLRIITDKETEITAGGDFRDALVSSTNINPSDVSYLTAGGDIVLSRSPDAITDTQGNLKDYSGVEHGGPGYLFLMAGNNIDLGNSQGVRTVGETYNGLLGGTGSSLVVVAGSKTLLPQDQVVGFFDSLRQAGVDYSNLQASGDTAAAQAKIDATRSELIDPFLKGFSSDAGSISMVQSQISTSSEGGDIYIVATKDIDVGRSALNQANVASTGIFTDKGGKINIFSRGDLNVNVSRVMTFFGGDITVWSDGGNINAGRGSKTAISTQPPHPVPVFASDGVTVIGYKLVFNPPSVGSGMRAVTYDPNSYPGEGLTTPNPGDIYAFTPSGVIDAGEAGIAGGRVVLGATKVLNAQNISFSAGAVGVPSSEGGVSLGALAGAGSVTDSSKMIEQSSSVAAARDKTSQQSAALDDFMSKWLDLKIISFDDDSGPADGDGGGSLRGRAKRKE